MDLNFGEAYDNMKLYVGNFEEAYDNMKLYIEESNPRREEISVGNR